MVFEIFATFIESFLSFRFNHLLLREEMDYKRCLVLSAVLSVIIFFINVYDLFSLLTLVVAVGFVTVSGRVFLKTSLFDVFCVTSFYSLFVMFFDFFSMAFLGMLLGNSDLAKEVVMKQSVYRCTYLVLSKSLLILGYYFIRKTLIRWDGFKVANLVFITVLGYIGVIYFARLTFESISGAVLIQWFLLFLIVVLAFFSLVAYIRYMRELDENRLLELRNTMMAERYEEVSGIYRENAQLYHDMRNHLSIIDGLLARDQYGQAKRYIKELYELPENHQWVVWTGDEVIDCILCLKKNCCEKLGIVLTVDADPLQIRADHPAVSSIVSNILDNAIEACQNYRDSEKWIHMAFRHINDILIIKIENPVTEGTLITDQNDEFPMTHKTNKHMHGWGMKNINVAVQKVGGVFTYSQTDNKFVVIITLFL